MTLKTWGLLCALALTLLACTVEEAEESLAQEEAALETQSDLYPECCTTINTTVSEAFCDSVSYSEGRCNEVWGGGACLWTCGSCCRPQNASIPDAYCAQIEPLGRDRCNAADMGTSCVWTCR